MTETITSPQNPLIKATAALRQKKFRDESGLFALEGVRLAEELAGADWPAEYCLFTDDAARNGRVASLLARLEEKRCRMIRLAAGLYAKVTDTEQPQGVMVVARQRRRTLDEVLTAAGPPLLVVLDGVQDPGNVGTVIRTADAAGCSGVVLLKGCADLFAGKTVRAAMGSTFHLPIVGDVARDVLVTGLIRAGVALWVTALTAATPYTVADLTSPLAMVLGNEGQGVSAELMAAAQQRLTIPVYGRAESLNVATAAAVILYEAARQRRSIL